MFACEALLAAQKLPDVFTREHDVILLAEPFSVFGLAPLTQVHQHRLAEAFARRFFRSARAVEDGNIASALEHSRMKSFGYRLTGSKLQSTGRAGLLVTCAPNAHLALATFLERGALFTVEAVGRVTLDTRECSPR